MSEVEYSPATLLAADRIARILGPLNLKDRKDVLLLANRNVRLAESALGVRRRKPRTKKMQDLIESITNPNPTTS